MSYNSSTGVLAAGQRGAFANVYTGNYATGGRGVATGPGGITAAGRGGTIGNVNTGNQVSGGRGVIYNENTGNATSVAGIKGENGGAVRVGDDVFAGKDGNVYKRTDGGWEQVNRPEPRASTRESSNLNQERYSRDSGAQRSNMNRQATGSMHRSFGGGRRR